jgi:predicted dinucleotide-binding enzyme
VVLAVRPEGLENIVSQGGDWSGKVVIDAMNRFSGSTESIGEEVARRIPNARIVKAFNTIGAEHYGQPNLAGQSATMFICGDDARAKSVAARLAEELGGRPGL